ncbi:MAG TPA: hypothetical protein VK843_05015 [Planctomycetota bacterium]|nr:hypothetical protein [Planctomycetota bacterium]
MKSISAFLMTVLLVACGSSDPKTLVSDGHKAQGSGDSKTAEAKFTEALEELKPGDALYIEAKLGRIEALIAKDAKLAKDEFLTLAASTDMVGEKDFTYIGGQLVSAHKYLEALDLVHKGIQRAGGESPALMVQIERIKKEAAADAAVGKELASLGYL